VTHKVSQPRDRLTRDKPVTWTVRSNPMIRIECPWCDEPIAVDGAAPPAELRCDGCAVRVDVVDPAVRALAEVA
jgi:hypothetical protein